MSTDLILFLAVCTASALVAWASTRDVTMPSWTLLRRQEQQGRPGGAEAHW